MNTSLMKPTGRILLLSVVAPFLVVLLAGARPAAAAAACAAVDSATHVASQQQTPTSVSEAVFTTNDSVTPLILTWTPYDGAKITSSGNCAARMSHLKGARPDIKSWKCERFYVPACPTGYYYWMVMVGTNY